MGEVYIKRICYILLILGVYATDIFAAALSSDNYTLVMPRIVTSGGSASSASYSIDNASIGGIFGGTSGSANYSLDADLTNKADDKTILKPPTLNPVITPTNVSIQTLSGAKESDTSIYINGYAAVSLDNEKDWSYSINLAEGDNHLIITARNAAGLESEPVYASIILDTVPPFIIINSPLDGTIVYTTQVDIEGTIDGAPFTQEENLHFGLNQLTVEASDEAGNMSFESVELYLVREPPSPHQVPAQ